MDARKLLVAYVLQVVGAVSLTVAGFVLAGAGVGFVVLGVATLLFGVVFEREAKVLSLSAVLDVTSAKVEV